MRIAKNIKTIYLENAADYDKVAFLAVNRDEIKKKFGEELSLSLEETNGNIEAAIAIPNDGDGKLKGYPQKVDRLVNGRTKEFREQSILDNTSNIDLIIIEGMNRVIRCRELGLECKITVDPTISRNHLELFNDVKYGWDVMDRIKNRADEGHEDCRKLLEQIPIWEDKGFTLSVIIEIFKDKSVTEKAKLAIKKKTYKIDVEHGIKVLQSALTMGSIVWDKAKTRNKPTASQFVRGLNELISKYPSFDPQRTESYMLENDLAIVGLTGSTTDIANEIKEHFFASFNTEDRILSREGKIVVLEDYGYKCAKCGVSGDLSSLDIDHVQDHQHNGSTSIKNSQPLCGECHSNKPDCRIGGWLGNLEENEVEDPENPHYDRIVLTNHAIERVKQRYSNLSSAEFIRMVDQKDKKWDATETDKDTGDLIYTVLIESDGEDLILKAKIDTTSREGQSTFLVITFYTIVK